MSITKSYLRHVYLRLKYYFKNYPVESAIFTFWLICAKYSLTFTYFVHSGTNLIPLEEIPKDCVRCSVTIESASRSLRLAISAGQRGRKGDTFDDISLIYSPWNDKMGTIDQVKFTSQINSNGIEGSEDVQLNYIPTSLCPNSPADLKERVPILKEFNETLVQSLPETHSILPGGFYHPQYCLSTMTTNIIVPLRGRETQLKLFLQHMHQFLPAQLINYQIFVIEQEDEFAFNRGKLMNIGYVESLNLNPSACCFIFHDVDLLPRDQRNIYSCSLTGPRHICAFVNEFRYTLLYASLFGGAVAITRSDFKEINGFPNIYFGWGGEDDDLSRRVAHSNKSISRWEVASKCDMLIHKKQSASTSAKTLLQTAPERFESDGLQTLRYKVKKIKRYPLYTRITVQL